MFQFIIQYPIRTLFLTCVTAGAAGYFTPAHAQMANNPWGFQQQNRASVAALIRQVENDKGAAAVTQIAAQPIYSNTSLVCGSDGKSSANGNSTCIILNNAAGDLSIGQDSQGSQTATSETSSTQTGGTAQSNADEILATLETVPGN